MKIELESTTKCVTVNGVPARVWEGKTSTGIPVHVYVTRIAVEQGRPDSDYQQFLRDLKECRKPSAKIESLPTHLIL